MESKIIDKGNYKIHLYKTDKFKRVGVYALFRTKSKVDNYVYAALRELLYLTSEKYKNKIDRYIKEEDLYNSSLMISDIKYCRELMINLNIEYIDPKIINDDINKAAIDYIFDVFNNPVFDESKLQDIKDKLIFAYNRRMERPASKADLNARDLYFEDPVDKANNYVPEDIVNNITMDMLKAKYEEIVNNATIDVYVLGNIDESIVQYVDDNMKYSSKNIDFVYRINNPLTDKVKEKIDIDKDVNQAQIVMYFNGPEYDRRRTKAAILFSLILGGGGLTCRLFDVVREKNHLCYNIRSSYSGYESTMSIHTSVDNKNVDKTIKLINEVIDSMSEIKDEEIEIAKAAVISDFESIGDDIYTIFRRLVIEELLGRETLEEEIEEYKSITKEEIIAVKDMIKLNTLYVLKGE